MALKQHYFEHNIKCLETPGCPLALIGDQMNKSIAAVAQPEECLGLESRLSSSLLDCTYIGIHEQMWVWQLIQLPLCIIFCTSFTNKKNHFEMIAFALVHFPSNRGPIQR